MLRARKFLTRLEKRHSLAGHHNARRQTVHRKRPLIHLVKIRLRILLPLRIGQF